MGKKLDKLVVRIQALEKAIAAMVTGKKAKKSAKKKKSAKAKKAAAKAAPKKKATAEKSPPKRRARKAKPVAPPSAVGGHAIGAGRGWLPDSYHLSFPASTMRKHGAKRDPARTLARSLRWIPLPLGIAASLGRE